MTRVIVTNTTRVWDPVKQQMFQAASIALPLPVCGIASEDLGHPTVVLSHQRTPLVCAQRTPLDFERRSPSPGRDFLATASSLLTIRRSRARLAASYSCEVTSTGFGKSFLAHANRVVSKTSYWCR